MSHLLSRNDALWAIVAQLLLVVLISPIIWLVRNKFAASSFIVGGVICVLPNIYLYRRVFAHFGAQAAKKIVRAFYWGEAIKLVLTGCLFAFAILIPWMKAMWLFLGYIAAQCGFWVAPIGLALWRSKSGEIKRDERG